jgi:hypothetical protein
MVVYLLAELIRLIAQYISELEVAISAFETIDGAKNCPTVMPSTLGESVLTDNVSFGPKSSLAAQILQPQSNTSPRPGQGFLLLSIRRRPSSASTATVTQSNRHRPS